MLSETTGKVGEPDTAISLRKKAGAWLRARRCELGLSQRELAYRVNIEYYTFISQIEAGRGRVPSERLHDWAKALEMAPREFAINLMKYYDPHTYSMIFSSFDEE
jgi:transcriptional regulator with XRE-family HTH domain